MRFLLEGGLFGARPFSPPGFNGRRSATQISRAPAIEAQSTDSEDAMTSRNPYFLDGPSQFGFSGGRSSAYMLEKTVEAHGGTLPGYVFVTFHNTGKERPETLEFVRDVGSYLGVHVYWTEFTGVYGSGLSWRITDFEHAERNGEPFERVLEYYKNLRAIEKGEPPILPNPANRMCTDRTKIKAAS
ncbi:MULTISPECIES: hypothetical protein [Burkholderia cepacia complex]|uniref:hypothetical protein n=1 Tax=Burkholderia cepacia complex TaxID=87882 RepID=UPI000F5A8AF8|nr:hypothetical protein [Burkholderia cenocepacia]MBR8507404.1 hypothetical protein [Burkholderia cenocepacia]